MSVVLGPNRSYLSLSDESFVSPNTIDDSPLRPSNAGICERELFLRYKAWKEQSKVKGHDVRIQRIFNLGHAIEKLIIDDFKKLSGFKVLYGQQIMDHGLLPGSSQLFQGSMDWCLISEEHKVVMDAKSRGGRGSYTWDKEVAEACAIGITIDDNGVWIADTDAFVKSSKDHELVKNILQLNVYATSRFCEDRGINHASIVRYNKLNSEQYEFRFAPSKTLLNYVLTKFARVAVAKSIDELQSECIPGSMKQRYCWACAGRKFEKVTGTNSWGWKQVTLASLQAGKSDSGEDLSTLVEFQRKVITEQHTISLQQWMEQRKINSILLDDNTLLTLELLKSPNPHYEFRIKRNKKDKL